MALIRRPVALTLRALGLGDFLTGLPALRALRRGLPDHEHVLAAPPVLQSLLDLADLECRLHPVSGLGSLDWAGEPPGVAVNLHGKGPQSTRLLASAGPGRLIAFGSAGAGVDGPRWRRNEHEVDRWCRLVTEGLGLPADPSDLGLRVPPVAPSAPGAVIVHPGAAFASRRWPLERFCSVARWAAGTGEQVVVTGSAAETELAEKVAAGAALPPDAVLAGRTSLLELAAVVSRARLLICGDTGIAHLAAAYRRPSVVLFGPVGPHLWGPPAEGPHAALWHGGTPGNPWGSRTDPALLAISVDEVIAAAARLLRENPSDRQLPGDVPLERAGEAFV